MTPRCETLLVDALLSALETSEYGLDRLAEMLAPRLSGHLRPVPASVADGWLDSRHAAEYVGLTTNALHKLTAARCIPFEQDGPGCKCWFRRSDLDEWRRGGRDA